MTTQLTLTFSDEEMQALNGISEKQEVSKNTVMRQALRLYQLVLHRLESGETLQFSGDTARAVEIVGIGFPFKKST